MSKMALNKYFILMQLIFVVLVLTGIFFVYPRTNLDIEGDFISFNSINAKVIIISENPDFSNPRYLDLEEIGNSSFKINPGTYYWKADNGILTGLTNEFTIDSEVGMEIENDSELVNVGNVKLNVSKNKNGVFVGHIILEPDESTEIENKNETYVGRQE